MYRLLTASPTRLHFFPLPVLDCLDLCSVGPGNMGTPNFVVFCPSSPARLSENGRIMPVYDTVHSTPFRPLGGWSSIGDWRRDAQGLSGRCTARTGAQLQDR